MRAGSTDTRHSSFLLRLGERYMKLTANENKDFAEAERTFHQMVEVYRHCDYTISELPKVTPADRAKFILEQLQLDA